MVKKRKSRKIKGSTLKRAMVSCKGKRGKAWKSCLRKKGIKVRR